jgi:hypothetical protein
VRVGGQRNIEDRATVSAFVSAVVKSHSVAPWFVVEGGERTRARRGLGCANLKRRSRELGQNYPALRRDETALRMPDREHVGERRSAVMARRQVSTAKRRHSPGMPLR